MSGHDFRVALVGGIIGALLVGMLTPVGAAIGDTLKLGQVNAANATTSIRGSSKATLKLVQEDASGRPMKLKGPGKKKKVKYLNADRVDGFHAHSLVRVAYDEASYINEAAVFGSNHYGDILSTEITAPTRGLLFMVAGAQSSLADTSAAGDSFQCSIRVNDTEVIGSGRYVLVAHGGTTHTSNKEEDCATSGVKEVAAGTWTVDLYISGRGTSPPQVEFGGASLQVLFVPFGGDGKPPSL
jgi:hypothetical protein